MLRYPEDNGYLKVSVSGLKNQESPSSKLPSRQETKKAKRFLKIFGKEKKMYALSAWPDGTRC